MVLLGVDFGQWVEENELGRRNVRLTGSGGVEVEVWWGSTLLESKNQRHSST